MNTRQYAVLIAGFVALSAGAAAILPAGALGSQAQETASVSFTDQTVDDDTVTVESATLPEGGFVVIHESDDGDAGDVVGVSEYLESGESADIAVELDDDVEDEEDLVAMAHLDSDGDEAFDFVETDGEEDGPYTTDGEAVVDSATVTAEDQEDEGGPPEEAGPAEDADPPDEEADDDETDEAAVDGLAVTELDAPADAVVGETLTVTATVENQGDSETTERVEFRLDGQLVANQDVTAEADEEATVSFAVDSGLRNRSEGEFRHGVFTESDWQLASIDIEESFELVDLDAPANATVGETVTADATVRNPNEAETTQTVAFRFDGAVADSTDVDLDGGEEETVSLDVNSSGVDPGNYTHGVFTVTEGAFADIELVPAPPEASIDFDDQPVDNDTVTIDSVSVEEGGFVAIHDDSLLDGDAVGSVIGVSEYLDPGEYEDLEVELFDVPGADFENETLDGNGTLIAMPHLDTNDNETYDFVATDGAADGPYTDEDGNATLDDAAVTVEEATAEETEEATEEATAEETEEATEEATAEETEEATAEETEEPAPVAPDTETEEETEEPATEENETADDETETPQDEESNATATVDLGDQASNGTTVTVDSVDISEGGYVAVHNVSLLDGDAVGSVIGVSEYLDPGEYEDVEIELFDVPGVEYERDRLAVGQTLYAMPHRDTDDDEAYDFVATNGSTDGPYADEDGNAIVDDGNLVVESEE
ncbi:CARDB protein [Halorientalis persicus]|uniref:CARDB protein n=1 Tax=Halorientalis persicus TaxID=1367881 RepID=A0A1H8ITU3_9EURY|nr:CARDB domain-containing protein [Halorientalis persicus]SEN71118.1 CARDB protein [Halorientalis persicus]